MIVIQSIKKTTGKGMIKQFEKTYGTMEKLEKLVKEDSENMIASYDLDEWKYFLKHLDEEIEDVKQYLGNLYREK